MGGSADSLLLTEPVRCWCHGLGKPQKLRMQRLQSPRDRERERDFLLWQRERERESLPEAATLLPTCSHVDIAQMPGSLPPSDSKRCLLMTGVPCLGDPDHKGVAAQGIDRTQACQDLECEHGW